MLKPKVPKWMQFNATHNEYEENIDYEYACYKTGDTTACLDGGFTATELRELADLIDSCQEES